METSIALSMPPGFGFHPTDVELISHYLKRKILGCQVDLEVIPEVDIYKYEPWDLPAKSLIQTRDSRWHFFSSRDKKYPNGSRSNRATKDGYWKSTGKDRNIRSNNQIIGTKKTLVFHQGRPPYGKRSEWIMHEYYLNDDQYNHEFVKDIFVLCRITKRNGITPEEEEVISPQEMNNTSQRLPLTNKNNAKSLEDIFLGMMPKKETPSPPAHVDDFDSWLAELSDANICTLLPPSQPINDQKVDDFSLSTNGNNSQKSVSLLEDFLGFNSDPLEVNYDLIFEDFAPVYVDSMYDYQIGHGSDPYGGLTWEKYEVNTTQVHKSKSPAIVDQTFVLDSANELRTHIIDYYVEEEKPRIPEKKSSLVSFPPKESSSRWRGGKLVKCGRRERISHRCRDYLRKARGLVRGVRFFLRRSSMVGLNYVLWVTYIIGMAMMMAFLMVMDAVRVLYGSCR